VTSSDANESTLPPPPPPPSSAQVYEVHINGGLTPASRGLVARIGVVAVVVALLGAGLVAVQGFGSSGGSESPERAVEQLLVAVGNEDFLGAAELVEPAERRTLVDPAIEVVGELKRLRVLADDFDLGAVRGVDYEFVDMTYAAEPLGPGVARVRVDGTASATGNVDELRLGELVLENVPAEELQAMQDEAAVASTEAIDDIGIVTVERGGRWYVSMWYSIAELARREAGKPAPAFGDGPTPAGGETPEETIETLAAAAADLDLGSVIAMLDPEEMAALYDYSTLFLDDADAAAAEFRAETPDFVATVDRLDLRSEINGDRAEVWIDGVAVSASGGGEGMTMDTADDCILFTYDEWNPDGECLLDRETAANEQNEWGIEFDMADFPSPSVRMRRVDGRWYLSPTDSLVQPMVELLRALDADRLQRWIDDPDLMLEESPELLQSTPALAGMAVLGIGAVYLLGTSLEQSFDEGLTVSPADDLGWQEWEQEWEEAP